MSDKVQLIKEEIERRINVCEKYSQLNLTESTHVGNHAQLLELRELKDFIDSLQEETKPQFSNYESVVDKVFGAGNLESWEYEEAKKLVLLAKEELLKGLKINKEPASKDLQEEIDKIWKTCNPIDEGMGVEIANIHIEQFDNIVKYFCDWQKKKDQEIDKLTESPDLDEASWNYSDRDGITYGQRYAMQIDFKAGAEWHRHQMIKDAVDATILDIDEQTIEFGLWPEKLLPIKEGNEVKIIVLKKN